MYKYFLLFLLFLVQLPVALQSMESREYYYIQYNVKFNIYNSLAQTYRSENEDTKEVTTSHIHSKLKPLVPFYNGSLYLGWHFDNDYSVEFEFADNDIFYTHVNGKEATGFDAQFTTTRNYYYSFNLKKDFFDIFSENHIIYGKAGIGFTQIDMIERTSGDGGNRMDPIIQLGMGYTYVMSDFIDLDTQIKYFVNIPRLEELAGYSSIGFKAQMQDIALFVGIKFKIL